MKRRTIVPVLLACLLAVLSAGQVWASKTVYLVDNAGWGDSHWIYAWKASNSSINIGAWHGQTMKEYSRTYQNQEVYTYTISNDEIDKVIFNNKNNAGAGQTQDLDLYDGALYIITSTQVDDKDGNGNPVKRQACTIKKANTYEFDVVNTHTAYLVTEAGWDIRDYNAHIWEKNVVNYRTDWPGLDLELIDSGKTYDGKKVYEFYFSVSFTPKNIIFNNGNTQTDDLTFADNNLYILGSGTHQTGTNTRQDCDTFTDDEYFFDGEGLPDQLMLAAGSETLTADKSDDNKYVFTLTADVNTLFYFTDGTNTYRPTATANQRVAKEGTYTTKKNSTLTNRFEVSDGYQYTLTAYFTHGVMSFDVASVRVWNGVYPELGIRGDFTGADWAWNTDFVAQAVNGVYTWTFPDGFEWYGENGEFKIATEDWDIDISTNNMKMVSGVDEPYACQTNINGSTSNMALDFQLRGEVIFRLDLQDFDNPTFEIIADDQINPTHPRRLYMSFGQEFIYEGNRSKAPRVKLLTAEHTNKNAGVSISETDFKAAIEMKPVFPDEENSPLFYADLSEKQYRDTKDMVFLFEPADFDANSLDTKGYRQFIAGRADTRDKDYWTYYIYYADNGKAAQSYMTMNQYRTARDAEKEKLYILGRGLKGLKGWDVIPSDPTLSGIDAVEDLPEADEACLVLNQVDEAFYGDVEFDTESYEESTPSDGSAPDNGQKGAGFKISWIRPAEYFILSGKSGEKMDSQRAWATFNLGIVGFRKIDPVVENEQLPLVYGAGNDLNAEVYITPCRVYPINNYNQANWFIREDYMGGSYTLIVGLDGCQSIVLVPFEPNPTLGTPVTTVRSHELSIADAEAAYSHNGTQHLAAEEGSGKVLFTKVNVASAVAKISAERVDENTGTYTETVILKDNTEMNTSFEVEYEIYADDVLAGVYKGVPGDIRIDGVTIGKDAELSVRAKYTDVTSYNGKDATNMTFHSKMTRANLPSATMPSIDEANVTSKSFTSGSNFLNDPDLSNHRYTLGAYASVEVTAPETTYDWYADFHLETDGESHHDVHPQHINGGEVVHASHLAASKNGMAALEGFNPWEDGDYSENNNWSAKLAENAGKVAWPLHLPEVVEVRRTYTDTGDSNYQFTQNDPKVAVKGYVKAVYPFLIDTKQVIQVTAAQGLDNAPARPRKIGENTSPNYVIRLQQSEPMEIGFSLDNKDLTAIMDIIAPQGTTSDADTEYYNLQGMRMSGELAPGVYIRRKGTETSKIIIR